jgi:hypothetical protein
MSFRDIDRNEFLDIWQRDMLQSRVYSHALYRHLERRFDGEIPDHLRRLALAGSRDALEKSFAQANSRCCDALALTAVRVAAARGTGSQSLSIWRREGLAWRASLRQDSLRQSPDLTLGFPAVRPGRRN